MKISLVPGRWGPLLRPLDYAALVLALAAAAGSAALVYGGPGGRERFVIRGGGRLWVYPTDGAETLSAPGPLGDTVIEIRDGAARVLSSPCANQTCVAAGPVRSRGEWIACLPNRVMVSVEAREASAGPSGDGEGPDVTAW